MTRKDVEAGEPARRVRVRYKEKVGRMRDQIRTLQSKLRNARVKLREARS